jgi:hypothetical protein
MKLIKIKPSVALIETGKHELRAHGAIAQQGSLCSSVLQALLDAVRACHSTFRPGQAKAYPTNAKFWGAI